MSIEQGQWGEAWMAAYRDARADGLSHGEAAREADQTEGRLPDDMYRTALKILREKGYALDEPTPVSTPTETANPPETKG